MTAEPSRAVDLDPLQIAGIDGRAGLDHAQGAVGELDRGHGDVLDGDPLVGQQGRPAADLDHRAHQPGEQIDAVDGLVHQGAAAVEFPRAAPRAAVVVGLGAIPLDDGVAEGEPAEAASARSPASTRRSNRGTARGRWSRATTPALRHSSMIWSQRRSVISSGFSTMTCLPARAAATAGSRWAPLGVPMVTTSTRRVGQHGLQVVIRLAAGAGGQAVGRGGHGVVAGHELRPADVGDRPGVKVGDHPAADDSETDSHKNPPASEARSNKTADYRCWARRREAVSGDRVADEFSAMGGTGFASVPDAAKHWRSQCHPTGTQPLTLTAGRSRRDSKDGSGKCDRHRATPRARRRAFAPRR